MSSRLVSAQLNGTPEQLEQKQRLQEEEEKEQIQEQERKKKERNARIEKDGARLFTEIEIAESLIRSYPPDIQRLVERSQQLRELDKRNRANEAHSKSAPHPPPPPRKRKLATHNANLRPIASPFTSDSSSIIPPPKELKFGLHGNVLIRMHRFTSSAAEELEEDEYEQRKNNGSRVFDCSVSVRDPTVSIDPRKKRRKLGVIPEESNDPSTSTSNEHGQPHHSTPSNLPSSSHNHDPSTVPRLPKKRGRKSNAQKREEEAERERIEREKAIAEGRNPDTINLKSRKRGLYPRDYRDLIFVCLLTTRDEEDDDYLEDLSRRGKSKWRDWKHEPANSNGFQTSQVSQGTSPGTSSLLSSFKPGHETHSQGPVPPSDSFTQVSNPTNPSAIHFVCPIDTTTTTTDRIHPSAPKKLDRLKPPQARKENDESLSMLSELPHLTEYFTRTHTIAFHRSVVFPQLGHTPSWFEFEDIELNSSSPGPSDESPGLSETGGSKRNLWHGLGGLSGMSNYPSNSTDPQTPPTGKTCSNDQSLTCWDPAMKFGAFPLYLLPVPSIQEFKFLLNFLYTHDLKRLQQYLLPERPPPLRRQDIPKNEPLDTLLLKLTTKDWKERRWQKDDFAGLDEEVRIKHVKRIKRIYTTAKWLTVRNEDMWRLLSACWVLICPSEIMDHGPPDSSDTKKNSYSSGRGFTSPELYNRIEINFWNCAIEERISKRRAATTRQENNNSKTNCKGSSSSMVQGELTRQTEIQLTRKRQQEQDSNLLSEAMFRLLQTRQQRDFRKHAPPSHAKSRRSTALERSQKPSQAMIISHQSHPVQLDHITNVDVVAPSIQPTPIPPICFQTSLAPALGDYCDEISRLDTLNIPRFPTTPTTTSAALPTTLSYGVPDPQAGLLPITQPAHPLFREGNRNAITTLTPMEPAPSVNVHQPRQIQRDLSLNPFSLPLTGSGGNVSNSRQELAWLDSDLLEVVRRVSMQTYQETQSQGPAHYGHDHIDITQGRVWMGGNNEGQNHAPSQGFFDSSGSHPFDFSVLSNHHQQLEQGPPNGESGDNYNYNYNSFWDGGTGGTVTANETDQAARIIEERSDE